MENAIRMTAVQMLMCLVGKESGYLCRNILRLALLKSGNVDGCLQGLVWVI